MISPVPSRQGGVGLIEVMVTVLILATSLLAMGALQTRSLQFNHSAYLRSQANVMAYDILDRMRINSDKFSDYERDFSDSVPTGSDLADEDLEAWLGTVSQTLPDGEAKIDCDSDRVCSVSLRWTEHSDIPGAVFDPAAPDTATFTYTTRL